jgi:hypothetical protein
MLDDSIRMDRVEGEIIEWKISTVSLKERHIRVEDFEPLKIIDADGGDLLGVWILFQEIVLVR